MQETRVRSLIQEDATCCRATNPVGHDTEPAVLERPGATTTTARTPRGRALQ